MSARPHPILAIRFSRRVADRCRRPGAELPDWVVCDTIANGRRQRLGPGTLVRFERTFAREGARKLPEIRVCVLVEMGPREWVAQRILAPAPRSGKNSAFRGFLHRSGPK